MNIFKMFFSKKVEVGEIYIFDDEIDNPFVKEEEKPLVRILDIKNGWIKYEHINSSVFKNEHMSNLTFRTMYSLYKK